MNHPVGQYGENDHRPKVDWTNTPAAIVASVFLVGVSLAGMGWSWRHSLANEGQLSLAQRTPTSPLIEQYQENPEVTSSALSVLRKVDLNSANIAELDLLPGIGPALAERIYDNRQEHGVFETLDALDRVSGIGPRTIEKIEGYAFVGDGG